MLREIFQIPSCGRDLFALLSRPRSTPRGLLIHVPPFAEEMNKARRMTTLAVQGFVEDGWSVLQFDLSGCGDSSEEFEEVTWETWVEDLDNVVAWSRSLQPDIERTVLWGLRGGCLVVGDWLAHQDTPHPLLLWQPALNGKLHLTQFLRLRAANELFSDADAKSAMSQLRARLDAGEAVQVAGYTLSPELAGGMARAALDVNAQTARKVGFIEVSSAESEGLSPMAANAAAKWSSRGVPVITDCVRGPAFWSTQYIETLPELVAVSRRALEELAT